MKLRPGWTAAILVALAAVVLAVVLALRQTNSLSARCPTGFLDLGVRCCAKGQTLESDQCRGTPLGCPSGFLTTSEGCVVQPRRVRLSPGRLKVGPGDWEAQGVVIPKEIVIDSVFWVDAFEVTVAQWNSCVEAGACERKRHDEPGRPARALSFSQAKQFCSWAGGSLLSDDEWVWVAAGPKGRRYPWGDTGAVCGRACWGLLQGPCARQGTGPDWVGIHTGDSTPEGVVDLAGGVAEWVTREGTPTLRGGAWTSAFAAELRTWHSIDRDPQEAREDVGLRCRYTQDSNSQLGVLPSSSP